jgi:hypothetical protein
MTVTLDDPPGPTTRFLVADGPNLVHLAPPAIGGERVVPAPSTPHPFVP